MIAVSGTTFPFVVDKSKSKKKNFELLNRSKKATTRAEEVSVFGTKDFLITFTTYTLSKRGIRHSRFRPLHGNHSPEIWSGTEPYKFILDQAWYQTGG